MLQDGKTPIERHELRDEEWKLLGVLRDERDAIVAEELAKQQEAQAAARGRNGHNQGN